MQTDTKDAFHPESGAQTAKIKFKSRDSASTLAVILLENLTTRYSS